MNELSTEARAVLDAGFRAQSPTAADRARVRAALDARLAAESPASLPSGATPLTLGIAALVIAALVWWWAHRTTPQPAPQPEPPALSAPAVVAPPVVAPPVVAPPAVAPPPSAPPVVAPAEPPTAPRVRAVPALSDEDTLAEEMRLIGRARRAHAASNDPEAMAALSEHRRRFPRGTLTEEREATELLIRCARQEPGTAGRVAAFARRFPASPQRPRIDRVCTTARPE